MLLYLILAYRSNVQSIMSIYSTEIKKTSNFFTKHVTKEIADVRDLAGN